MTIPLICIPIAFFLVYAPKIPASVIIQGRQMVLQRKSGERHLRACEAVCLEPGKLLQSLVQCLSRSGDAGHGHEVTAFPSGLSYQVFEKRT